MGVVYRAHDARLKRDVAIKIMRWTSATAEQVARFSREAHAAGSLNHPNIIAVYDVGTERGMPFVVTELLEGETLRDKLRPGLLPFRRAVEIGGQIANALDAAHRKSIWHRDVKPANVFVTSDWRVKLLDFGIAKLSEPDPHQQGDIDTASQTAGFHGTPGYMSPEQVRGEPVDHRTDIFALGTVLYEMFTGKRAFQRETPLETMNAVVHAEPVDPLTLNPSLSPLSAAVVRRCLEKNKEDRFQTARDLAFQLQQLREPTTGPVRTPDLVPRPRLWRRVAPVAAVLLGAAAMALALWLLAPAPPKFDRLTFSRGRVGVARFSPEGTGAIYSLARQKHSLEISHVELSDGTSRPLNYDSGTDLLAVRSGELALLLNPQFVQGERFVGTLGRALREGAPAAKDNNVEAADWSASGELAVVRSTGTVGGDSWIEYPYPQAQPIYKVQKIISFLRVSADGEHLAFLEGSGDFRTPDGMVVVIDRTGKEIQRTKEWPNARGLAWSPGGREIWFTAAADVGSNRALRAVTLDGRQRVVFETPGTLTLWDIAADGRVLLTLDEERRVVMALPPGHTTEQDISSYDQSGLAAISSDGQWLLGGDRYGVLLRKTDGSSRPRSVLSYGMADDLAADNETALVTVDGKLTVMRPQANVPEPLPPGDIIQYNGGYWFPDSPPHRVLFTGKRAGEAQRSFVQELPNGAPAPITPPGQIAVAISPDGKWVAGIGTEDHTIPLWPVDGGAPKYVPGVTKGERPIAFGVGGKSLWFFRRGDIPVNLSTLDLETGKRQLRLTLTPADTAGLFAILGLAITPDGKAYAYSYSRVLSVLYLVKGLK